MALSAETTAITRALLEVLTALGEMQIALLDLKPGQDKEFTDHLEASKNARNQCLEHIKKLVDLMEKGHE